MRVGLVHNGLESWGGPFYSALLNGFETAGHEVETVALPEIEEKYRTGRLFDVAPPDVWYSCVFAPGVTDPILEVALHDRVPVVAHYHCGSDQRLFLIHKENSLDQERRLWNQLRRITFLTVATEAVKRSLIRYYGDWLAEKIVVVGYPADQGISLERRSRKGIVVPGRLDHDKQPFLAARILEPWRESVKHAQREEYLRVVGNAKVVFTASATENVACSLIEGAMQGSMVVCPDLPCYEHFPKECRYEPFSIRDAQRIVADAMFRRFVPVEYSFEAYKTESFIRKVDSVLRRSQV